MDKPKVSVIVPVYKTAKYLKRCFDSIFNQTYRDFEVIIVSDGPEEDDLICAEYANKFSDKITHFIKNVGKGLGGARNAGLDVATGEYVLFVDSDDLIEPETIEKAIACYREDIDLVVFGVNLIAESCRIRKSDKKYFSLKSDKEVLLNNEIILKTNVHCWNKLYRKSIIDKYNIRFPEYMQYEDFPFHFEYLLNVQNAYFLDKNLYNYVQRKDSEIRKTYKKDFGIVKDHILGCKFLHDELNRQGVYEKNKKFFSKIYGDWILTALKNTDKKDKEKLLDLAYDTMLEMDLENTVILNLLKNKQYKNIIGKFEKETKIKFFNIPLMTIRHCFRGKKKYYLFDKLLIFQKGAEHLKRKNDVYEGIKNKKLKIYFLLHAKAFLPSWQSFWDACKNDNRIEMKIIYCPNEKTKVGWSGQFDGTEEWLRENGFKYVHYKDINLLLDRPDVLFYQTPYDATHRNKSNNTDRMKLLGFNLAYISYGLEFTEAEHNVFNHFKLPIQRNCWRVYHFAQDIVEDYAKYCPIGNKHARCVGHPKFDALFNAQNIEMPQWLKQKVNGRKIICWHPHFPCNYSRNDGESVISTFPWEENLKLLEHVKNDKDNFYIFMAHHIFFGAFENDYNIPREEIESFKSALINGENSTIWEGEYPEVLYWSDFFLGERSAVTMEMITTGKPVIYLENHPEIYNNFGKKVINSYYYADNANKALSYLRELLVGLDSKKDLRKSVFDEYFAPYWDGKCGERIKEEILVSRKELKVSYPKIVFNILKKVLISISQKVFSITKVERCNAEHLVVTVLGIKFKKVLKRIDV